LKLKAHIFEVKAHIFEVKAQTLSVKAHIFEVKAHIFEVKAQTLSVKAQTFEVKAQKCELLLTICRILGKKRTLPAWAGKVGKKKTRYKTTFFRNPSEYLDWGVTLCRYKF
jgi:hypothetical protein